MRFAAPIAVCAALALGAAAGWAKEPSKDIASGVLGAKRQSAFHCEVVNKSGETVDNIALTLKRTDGSPIAGPEECDGVPSGQTCAIWFPVEFPASTEQLYCHANVPNHKFLLGTLRVEDVYGNTQAESQLVADVHGKIDDLIEKVDEILEH